MIARAASLLSPEPTPAHVALAVERACARVAPAWPLDRFIAVNPLWELTPRPLRDVAAELGALSGATLLMPLGWYREAWREGRFTERHLRAVARRHGRSHHASTLRAMLEGGEPEAPRRARFADVLDARRDLTRGAAWSEFVTHATSQFCAAYFDEGQALLAPEREGGLYASWRRRAAHDRSPALLLEFDGYQRLAGELPPTASEVFGAALAALEVPPDEHERYLASLLLAQNGWASWCAYRRWSARLEGREDTATRDLLAVRLAWEWLLRRGAPPAAVEGWRRAMAAWPRVEAAVRSAQDDRWLLQEAVELAWQAPLVRDLRARGAAPRPTAVETQVVFCIDVRSEVLRRALEARAPVQTLGFAGFFGLLAEYAPLGAARPRPHLPGLLAPSLRVEDEGGSVATASQRARRLAAARGWEGLRRGGASAFAFVEARGVEYAAALAADSLGLGDDARDGLAPATRRALRPRLKGRVGGAELPDDARAELAAGILRGMSLTRGFASVVALVGHGATTRNNPHAAGLQCGACGGQTGEVSARATAALLNDPAVRAGLAARGIEVPTGTRFVAGLHDTTTDEVALFDLDELPGEARPAVDRLAAALREAGDAARAERAPALGMGELPASRLLEAMRARAADWAEVRPEWGLAGNAAFIAAPRERCRHLNLRGRAFLHEYRHAEDPDLAVLEAILTAPLVVAHWINFQYYASTVDNPRYGSGNKVLHNVVGGHLGVFEGNGGDLRVGLPLQSLHDGVRWMHEPLRLSVFVDAPTDALDSILVRQDRVRQLVEHGWLHLFQIGGVPGEVRRHTSDGWRLVADEVGPDDPAAPPAT